MSIEIGSKWVKDGEVVDGENVTARLKQCERRRKR